MTKWETFFKDTCIDIFDTSHEVLDIGEGLRARKTSGNRYDPKHAWLQEYIAKVEYQVMDPVPDYKPDIVGDIHNIPLTDESIQAIFCLAVLEHVEDPIRAMQEMYRVLTPGGKALIYVPFLYYYHAHPGYYKDYWRFTYDSLEMLAKPFSSHEVVPVRLPIETLIRLTPFGQFSFPIWWARKIDTAFYAKKGSRQVGGYYVFLKK